MNPGRLVCTLSMMGLLCGAATGRAQSAASDTVDTLPQTIPIFPLQDAMLFPNVRRPLHIFEPRYRAMVADALKGDRIIGMVMLRPGYEAEYEGRPPVYPIGCAGVITEVEQLPDGRYLIALRGIVKFQIQSEDQSRPYRVARVEAIPEASNDEENMALRQQRPRLTALLSSMLPSAGQPPPAFPEEDLVNMLAQYVDIDPVDRQKLLELKGALARSEALIKLLEAR